MASGYSCPTSSLQSEQASSQSVGFRERGSRSGRASRQTCRLTRWNDENMKAAQHNTENMRPRDTRVHHGGSSAYRGEVSNYRIIRDQGFGGMKDFMDSHGLRVWNDEDCQTAHQIVESMKYYDEQHRNLPTFAERSADDVTHGWVIEDEMNNAFRFGNTNRNSHSANEELVRERASLTAQQQEDSLDDTTYHNNGRELEGDNVGSCGGHSQDIETGFGAFNFGNEGGCYDGSSGGGCEGHDYYCGEDVEYDHGYDYGYDYDEDYD
ncbi:hypothetical protein DSL72_001898 [Monilinia vaccinii-corymbosi]|uniref:Uncharacterized protein n=1 Tax=Monilinia vaccinii-corymbosi TaxID=61207 RepID=A0A8A3PB55_9HELO|nr:hypothetical protein DSL72_001898 [Monilinia vaccinii-corymbosi]